MAPRLTPQGTNLSTFNPPRADHVLSIVGLYEYHAKHSPDHPVFKYAHPGAASARSVTFSEAWGTIGSAAELISERCPPLSETALDDTKDSPVVGIYAICDTLTYIYTIIALMGLGYAVFPLATRNNAESAAHLLQTKCVTRIFVSSDEKTQGIVRQAKEILAEKGTTLDVFQMPTPEKLASCTKSTWAITEQVRRVSEKITIISHSTGSTGMPKPIPFTGKALIVAGNTPATAGEIDWGGKCVAVHTNPPSHGTGIFTLVWAVSCGATFALYPPIDPPTIPTPANFLAAWQACECDIVFCMPAFIEAVARDPANVAALKALDYVVFTGATMTKSIGDMLAAEGVRLVSVWGSTEVGACSKILPREIMPEDEWEFFEFAPSAKFHMEPQEGVERVYEPIKPRTETAGPQVTNTEVDGQPAWAMGDLLEQHPTEPNKWRVVGRKDDKIVFSTGQMCNPVEIENMLAQHPNIGTAIIFGHGRVEPGILLEPKSDQLDGSAGRAEQVEKYKDLVWLAIEKANEQMDKSYPIRRSMILVASPDKPLEHTLKGTTRRGMCLKEYQQEIDKLYETEADESPEKREFHGRM
ncbi:acetyl-CoA synthetase-like protein [Lenzites betulinus]|nr:acetyl-CoA synthetase-like protein [Lenzites betulinus]